MMDILLCVLCVSVFIKTDCERIRAAWPAGHLLFSQRDTSVKMTESTMLTMSMVAIGM
jgi:hypothetical protein